MEKTGNIPGKLDKFDAEFFGYSDEETDLLDHQVRMMIENAYEAVADAGVDPESLQGTRTAFFMGQYLPTSEEYGPECKPEHKTAVLQLYCQRVSAALGLKGQSGCNDNACASGLVALHQGMVAIRTGAVDQAIVAAINLPINPKTNTTFVRLNMISKTGGCKVFDAAADGYGRSEAVVSIFLQKRAVAKRVYAVVINSGTNCDGYKREGITFPRMITQV